MKKFISVFFAFTIIFSSLSIGASAACSHNWIAVSSLYLAPTCTQYGERGYKCSLCGAYTIGKISPLGHSWGKWRGVDKKEHKRVCARNSNHVEYASHSYNSVQLKAATCKNTGNTKYTCKDCGTYYTDYFYPPATEHKWDNGVVTKSATCTTSGIKTFTCKTCKTTKTVTIPSKGTHNWDSGVVTKKPTCSTSGIKTITCRNCGKTKTESIPPKGHSWDSGTVTKMPTETTFGNITYTCTVCQTKRSEKIEKLPEKDPTTIEPPTAHYEEPTKKPTQEDPTIPHNTFLIGDADFDGKITSADARLVLRASVGLEKPLNRLKNLYDVDGDNKISAADARLVLRYSVGLEKDFPVNKDLKDDPTEPETTNHNKEEPTTTETTKPTTPHTGDSFVPYGDLAVLSSGKGHFKYTLENEKIEYAYNGADFYYRVISKETPDFNQIGFLCYGSSAYRNGNLYYINWGKNTYHKISYAESAIMPDDFNVNEIRTDFFNSFAAWSDSFSSHESTDSHYLYNGSICTAEYFSTESGKECCVMSGDKLLEIIIFSDGSSYHFVFELVSSDTSSILCNPAQYPSLKSADLFSVIL